VKGKEQIVPVAASLVDISQLTNLLGNYAVGPARALADPFLPLKAQGYRRDLSVRMRALDKARLKEELPACDSFVSKKVDGECTMLLIEGGQCCSINPGGVVRAGLPFMQEAITLAAKAKCGQMLLAGELWVDRGKRERVHDVSRVARQPESQADVDSLRFAVFDVLEVDGKPMGKSYAPAWKQIESVFKNGVAIRPVETVRAKTTEEVVRAFENWVEKGGAEGVVVRSDAAGLFKIKPRITIDAAVLGFTEGTNGRTGMLHDMLLGLMRSDSTFQVLGRVGTGFSDEQRRDWLSDLKDMAAESDYAEVNDSVAYQMVRPEWVVEISVLDFINQTTRGGSIDRMVLDFDRGHNAYRAVRRLPLASPISPVLVRKREDKAIKSDDLRLGQVAGVVEVPLADANARQLQLPKSQILKREVFTKTMKGALMVRKLVLYATNKHTPGGAYPAFVAYLTDFSPNRATPLDRDIRVSDSQEQIEELYAGLKAEYILKGWAPAG
jgi:hypothetical protein